MCEDMEGGPSSCTAGMDIWVALRCPGEAQAWLQAGTWRRTHHHALQVWISGLLLCVLEEALACVRGHGGGPTIVHCRYGYLGCSHVSWGRLRPVCGDMEEDPSSCAAGMDIWVAVICPGRKLKPGCGDMEEDPSSYTAGMEIWVALMCPGGGSSVDAVIRSKTHHRVLHILYTEFAA